MNTSETQNTRPFGFWIKAVDRLMAAEFATAFENEGASRRDWRLLNVVDGTADARSPLHPGKLASLIERGWVTRATDGWELTDEGRAAKERLGALVDGIRATVTDAVSPDDYDTTVKTLEQIARAFGWDEETPLPRGHRGHRDARHGHHGEHGHRGFGRHGRPFGPRHGFGPGFGPEIAHGFGPGFAPHADDAAHFAYADDHRCEEHRGHGRGHGFRRGEGLGPESGHGHPRHHRDGSHDRDGHHGRHAQHAYERGFDAGFARGRDA